MGREILDVVEVVAVLVVVALLPLVVLAGRRRWLNRRGGSFECSARLDTVALVAAPPGAAAPWRATVRWSLGVGRYAADTFEWFRFFSLAFTPRLAWKRTDMAVLAVRDPEPAEIGQLFAAHRVVRFAVAERAYEVSMDARQLTGFLAWLEAAPPGTQRSPGSAH